MRTWLIGAIVAASLLLGAAVGRAPTGAWPEQNRQNFMAACMSEIRDDKTLVTDDVYKEICSCIQVQTERSLPWEKILEMKEKKDWAPLKEALEESTGICVPRVFEKHKLGPET